MNRGLFSLPRRQAPFEALDVLAVNRSDRSRCIFEIDFGTLEGWKRYALLTGVNWSNFTTEDWNNIVPGALYLEHAGTGATLHRAKLFPIPSGDVDMVIVGSAYGDSGTIGGMYITDGVTAGAGNQHVNHFDYRRTAHQYAGVVRYTNFTTFATQTIQGEALNANPMICKYRRSGATWSAAWSLDGRHWTREETFTPTGTPSYVGLGFGMANTSAYPVKMIVRSLRIFSPLITAKTIGQLYRLQEIQR